MPVPVAKIQDNQGSSLQLVAKD